MSLQSPKEPEESGKEDDVVSPEHLQPALLEERHHGAQREKARVMIEWAEPHHQPDDRIVRVVLENYDTPSE